MIGYQASIAALSGRPDHHRVKRAAILNCESSLAMHASSSPPPQAVASKFFVFATFMVLCQLAAVSLAQAVSAICRDVDTSVVVLPMFLEITRLFGGTRPPEGLDDRVRLHQVCPFAG